MSIDLNSGNERTEVIDSRCPRLIAPCGVTKVVMNATGTANMVCENGDPRLSYRYFGREQASFRLSLGTWSNESGIFSWRHRGPWLLPFAVANSRWGIRRRVGISETSSNVRGPRWNSAEITGQLDGNQTGDFGLSTATRLKSYIGQAEKNECRLNVC